MANEDKPRGRPGKPAGGRATQGKGPGAKPRGSKDGEMRSRGFKDGPGGGQGGQQGGKGEMRSRGFKDNPGGGGKPGGKSRGFKDRPGGAGPRRDGDDGRLRSSLHGVIDALGEAPLLLLKGKPPVLGRWVETAVVVIFGDGAALGLARGGGHIKQGSIGIKNAGCDWHRSLLWTHLFMPNDGLQSAKL